MTIDEVYVLGSGGHAKVVVATLQAAGHLVGAAYDDAPERQGQHVLGVPVRGRLADAPDGSAVIAIGDNVTRRRLARLGDRWIHVVHPAAVVHASVRPGAGTVVMAGAIIQPDTALGEHVIVNTGAIVEHDCVIHDHVHLAPGSRVCGGVTVGDGVLVGAGATVVPGVEIGADAVIGAGAVVVRDVPPRATVTGIPARPVLEAAE